MKRGILALAVLAAIALADPAEASPGVGVVSIAVDGCTGPFERTVLPGESLSIFASVIGHSQASTAYQVSLVYGVQPGTPLLDAWRFDAAGCQGPGRLTMDHLTPSGKACPNFFGAAATEQTKVIDYNPATGTASTQIAVRLNAGSNAPNPAQRYFLGRWRFDHAASVEGPGTPGVSCGGLEQPICFFSRSASWTGENGVEQPWVRGTEFVAAQGHPNCPCAADPCPVPARNSTWGAIKGQYR